MMNVLVISPHPDDETLGAGGTIRKLVSEGCRATWLNVTNMSEEIPGGGVFENACSREAG